MTHNIVAQFSCSLDEHGNFKEYRVVTGSVFNEEYNETLDSGTIVLSQVFKEDRLSNIKPYDFVRVFDKSSEYDVETGTYAFDKVYLVDNFDEKENNIKEHIFGYTINLMSETKLLEKIQCPNLMITHDIVDGKVTKKTIFEYIKRYMELYVPKIKFCDDGENWSYKPLIKMPDMSIDFSEATLRVDFSDNNFSPLGHGTNLYVFFCDSEQLPDNVDYDSVEVVSVSLDGDVIWSGETICTFDNQNGVFRMSSITENIYYGSNYITYKYKSLYPENDFYKRFNVPCADMPFTAPTLRQLLTTLMQQVGCIPVVKNRTLDFLDFQLEAKDFGSGDYSINNTVNYIRRSLSSDSFVNSLVNISEQVLDSGNEVICETLGFRDRNNLLLKQEENLALETSLPIFKVNKCILHAPGSLDGFLSSSMGCVLLDTAPSTSWPCIYYKEVFVSNGSATIKFFIDAAVNGVDVDVNIDQIYFLSRSLDNKYSIVDVEEVDSFVLNYNTTTADSTNYRMNGTLGVINGRSKTLSFSGLPTDAVGCMLSGTFKKRDGTEEIREFTFIRFANDDTQVTYHGLPRGENYWFSNTDWSSETNYMNCFIARYNLQSIVSFQTWDISKLVVEDSVRQLLERDFAKMEQDIPDDDLSTWTIDNLSKYVYGTVGYSIGSNKISGFSDVYVTGTPGLSWITKNKTYLENMVKVLEKGGTFLNFSALNEYFEGISDMRLNYYKGNDQDAVLNYEIRNLINYDFRYYNPIGPSFDSSGASFFTSFFVDLYYQPLNSFNLSYVKSQEELDYPLEQYDGNASGLTDFDRLSIHEQEQVDRIGNETLSISQRTTDFEDIQDFKDGPLVFKDDTNRSGAIDSDDNGIKYIIFKRSFSVGNNCFNASYTGSKDAVLKNYFTSIRTKYRAYQYVDYSQSVLRKERDTLFIRMATNYFDGDDKIFFGNKANEESSDLSFLQYVIYDIEGLYNFSEDDIPKRISYEIEKDVAKVSDGLNGYSQETQTVKNSVSCYSTNNMFGITYEYIDNVGAGPYLNYITTNEHLGGIPQTWQIWGDNYSLKHDVLFTNYIDFYSKTIASSGDVNTTTEQIRKIEKSPIVDPLYSYAPIFYVADNNKDYNNLKRTFYKDYAERINHTVQFIYYAPNKDVLVNENFISGAPVLQRYDNPFNLILGCDRDSNFNLSNVPHRTVAGENPISESSGDASFANGYIEVIKDRDINHPTKIRVYFHGYKIIKMAHYDSATQLTTDIAAFKCPKELQNSNNAMVEYFFTINDTKTDYVLSEKNGILYRKYKAKTYTEPDAKYKILTYIQNSGTQYINLGFVPAAGYDYELEYTDVSGSGSNYVMGSRVGTGTVFFGVTGEAATRAITVANTDLTINNYRLANKRYHVKAIYKNPGEGSTTFENLTDGGTYTGYQNTALTGATANVCVFALQAGNIHSGMRVHSLKIWKNGELFRDLVPAKNKNNVLGLYDYVNDVFYTNAGSGNFISGGETGGIITDNPYPRKVENIYDDEEE